MAETSRPPLIILNPEGIPPVVPAGQQSKLAPRLSSLHGRRIVVLDDGFPGVEKYVKAIGDRLSDRYADVTVRYVRKPSLSRPAPMPLIDEIVGSCDAAVVGVAA